MFVDVYHVTRKGVENHLCYLLMPRQPVVGEWIKIHGDWWVVEEVKKVTDSVVSAKVK